MAFISLKILRVFVCFFLLLACDRVRLSTLQYGMYKFLLFFLIIVVDVFGIDLMQ